jgi:hypothetical protein
MSPLTGSRRRDRVPVLYLLEKTGMMSVNQMAAETILMETWRLLNGESADKMRMTSYSSVSSMMTRVRGEGRLEVEAPTASFMYHGARL